MNQSLYLPSLQTYHIWLILQFQNLFANKTSKTFSAWNSISIPSQSGNDLYAHRPALMLFTGHLQGNCNGGEGLGARIAQLEESCACYPVLRSIAYLTFLGAVRLTFPKEFNVGSDPTSLVSFEVNYKQRSSQCMHAFPHMDSKDPDIHILDGWMLATKTNLACIIREDGIGLPLWLDKKRSLSKKNPPE